MLREHTYIINLRVLNPILEIGIVRVDVDVDVNVDVLKRYRF